MGLGIRKFIARRISELDRPNVYPLHRWMKLPTVEKQTVQKLYEAGMEDVSHVDLFFRDAHIAFTGKFFPDTSNESYKLYLFPQVKSSPVFFLIKKVKSSPIFFDLKKTTQQAVMVTFPYVKYYQPDNFSLRQLSEAYKEKKGLGIKIDVATEYLNLLDWRVTTHLVKSTLQIPQTKELLSTFLPTVEKIDLLDMDSFSSTELVLDKFSDMNLSTTGSMFYYQDFKLNEIEQLQLQVKALDPSDLTIKKQDAVNIMYVEGVHSPVKNLIQDTLANNTLFKSLEPGYELTEGLKADILATLPEYQQEGAEFLFNSELAFLYDDFVLGKEYQCISALKMLLRIRAVKSALIVTTKQKESIRDSRDLNHSGGMWQGGVSLLVQNYTTAFFNSVNNINSIHDFNNFINIITYEALEECFASSKISKEDLNVFGCIIFDDLSPEVFSLKLFNNINSELVCNYFWFLSDFDNPSFLSKVQNFFPDKELKTLAREKSSTTQLPENVYYDFFLNVDSDNSKIPADLITGARAKIGELVFTGNIMRVQPAINQLIHDSQRKTNFNLNSPDYGNKSKLLKYNIERIFARYDRVLVYTQFDDSGVQQLSEFLNINNIEFVKFDISDSTKTIEDKLERAQSYEGKLVYLTNLKQKGLFFKFPNVSHLINFDNWWNPIARFSIENNLDRGSEKTLTVFNYYFNNTVEYDLTEKLSSLGLKDKNIINSLTADDFYNIVDDSLWCEILGVETEEEAKVEEDNYSCKSLGDLVNYSEIFLAKLKLTGINSQIDILNYSSTINAVFNKSGESIKVIVKCVFARNLNSKYVKEIIKDFLGETTETKIFLITSGTIEKPTTVLPQNFSLIDGEKLKSFHKLFLQTLF